ncbi:hypothetical protein [Actinacidiphila rubida]|uniref:Uncharacterized protein n=1 Tax=Actinacidiphila rubida TaxID=310780 RepID=A0A1H8RQR0_9ACTN|nr:hypothetical protein [Actinacidiphila rubida]SEO68293.1 hypothetical protein SAMN05216267_103617 [Actinacidiphila rubida]
MIINPWRRVKPLDHAELAQLLPAPGDPVLSEGRQRLLEDFLMSKLTVDNVHRVRSRRRMAVRLAVPAALAAALTGTVLAINQATGGPASPAPATSRASADGSSMQITTAAYTLSRKPGQVVKVIFLKKGVPMPTRLRNDLQRMGVKARVYMASTTCTEHYGPIPDYEPESIFLKAVQGQRRDGVSTATIRLNEIPAGDTLEVTYVPVEDHGEHSYLVQFGLNRIKSPDSECIRAAGIPVHIIHPTQLPLSPSRR